MPEMSDLRTLLEYYRDLGVKELFSGAQAPLPVSAPLSAPASAPPSAPASAPLPAPVAATPPPPVIVKPASLLTDLILPSLVPDNDSLEKIRQDIGDCKRCRLHEGRTKIVFGSGNPESRLVFVGEGPGADEDVQGLPFVGKAGQLLTQMIDNTAQKEGIPIKRPDVYICNIVKCRPPENRTPLPDEMEICGQFVFRQILAMRPKAICTLGGTAAKGLLGVKDGVMKIRGQWFKWQDIPVMVTYHPSFLLRSTTPVHRREAWEDLKKVLHFVYG
jgi:uracil-DNA glycosylase